MHRQMPDLLLVQAFGLVPHVAFCEGSRGFWLIQAYYADYGMHISDPFGHQPLRCFPNAVYRDSTSWALKTPMAYLR